MGVDISVIICSYNRCDRLQTVLHSLGNLKGYPYLNWEIIVVDNNSKDQTKAVVESFIKSGHDNVYYLYESRQGKSYALNTAIEEARGGILAFTDDDVTVHPDWLLELKKIFTSCDCRGVGGKIIPVFEGDIPSWLRLEPPFLNPLIAFDLGPEPCVLTKEPFGANMAFKREVFRIYGLFRTDLGPVQGNPMGKGEDSEFCSRLFAANEPMMYSSDAIVYHPAEESRLQKKYFESWFFNFGRASIARSPVVPSSFVKLFGVPRFLYRQLITKWLSWQFTFDDHRRFCRKLELLQVVGKIVESYRRHRGQRSLVAVKQPAVQNG